MCGRYGAHMEQHAVGGLQVRPLGAIANRIASLGFNCVRLPFSLELWFRNPHIALRAVEGDPDLAALAASKDGRGLDARSLLDYKWYGVLEQDYFTIRRMDQYRDLRRIQ